MNYSIHWFRRDLRLQDNQALAVASQLSDGRVIPLFIVDPTLVQSSRVGVNRLAFLASRLRTLHHELVARGSGLMIAYGDPRDVLLSIAAEYGATMVTFERDTGPWGRQRDREIAQTLLNNGIAGQTSQTLTIVPPTTLKTGAGTPYTVFTPFYRAWRKVLDLADAFDAPQLIKHPHQSSTPIWPDWPESDISLPESSRAHAEHLLRQFATHAIDDYTTGRDMVAKSGTSRLSPYLRFGILSPQECARLALAHMPHIAGEGRSGAEVWLSELAWRDFYHQIMYNFPHVTKSSFRPVYDAIQWENNSDWFAAWCEGRTGYPIVDAAMHQLNQEGWMHNRARMIVSSFLTKDLLIDWRWGERYFMQKLLDGDTAANNGGWQWAAGTGTDAQPYFRIFNPVSQGQKFDPDGTYVKKYLPELRYVPTKFIHAPWLLQGIDMRNARITMGVEYPYPIVDHAIQRHAALAMYAAIKS
ncbi:MAG: cryptochrome/photolyase family protein [Roseiflexaceae bacterium]